MNLLKSLLCISALTVMLMFSCRKDKLDPKYQLETQTNAVYRKQAHGAIDAIIKQYSSSTSSSQTKFDEAVKLLDYNDVSEVIRPSRSPLILIHISKNDADGRKRYLAVSLPISKSDNLYHFEGIYSGKELTYIKQAIITNRIEKENIVTLRLLNENPLKEWDATGTKTVVRIAKPKSLLPPSQLGLAKGGMQSVVTKNVNRSNTTTSVPERKVNLVDETTECIEYYWVEYDPETGVIYSATYLYTVCTENGGGGGGGGSEDPPTYYSESQNSSDGEKIDDESEIGGNPGSGSFYDLVMWTHGSEVEYRNFRNVTIIIGVNVWPSTCTNPVSPYVDSYGNAGVRTIRLSNHTNSWSWFIIGQLVTCHWKCDALGTYVSPGLNFTKFWTRKKDIIRG